MLLATTVDSVGSLLKTEIGIHFSETMKQHNKPRKS